MTEQYEAGRCVIANKPHRADHGYLCGHHFERLGAMLRDIEDEAALLSPVPSMQQRGGRGGSLASHRAPARLDVIVHTDRRRGTGKSEDDDDALAAGDTLPILDVLHSWARIVREERDLTPPEQVTVTGERAVLTRHLEWIAEQDWIDEAYRDIRLLRGQLKARNGTADDRPVGRCYLPGDSEEGTCDGDIWRIPQTSLPWIQMPDRCSRGAVDVADGPARCARCGNVWDGADVERLFAILREEKRPKTDDGQPMYTAEEMVARKIVSTVGNVRVMAHRRGIVSRDGYYDPRQFARLAEPRRRVV